MFSHSFSAAIWNMVAIPNTNILILESRDDKQFTTTFSALDFSDKKFLWQDVQLSEPWWIGLTAASETTVLFHTFVDKGNPDKKNLIAFDIAGQKVRWELESFSFFDWNKSEIHGYKTNGNIIKATVAIDSGILKEEDWQPEADLIFADAIKGQLYPEGSVHFEPLRRFMEQKAGVHLKGGAEYLEHGDWIIISAYLEENGLANYLYVFDKKGELVLREKLGEKLQGLGVDTFFILSGCLFLVKNKSELVAFRVYD